MNADGGEETLCKTTSHHINSNKPPPKTIKTNNNHHVVFDSHSCTFIVQFLCYFKNRFSDNEETGEGAFLQL